MHTFVHQHELAPTRAHAPTPTHPYVRAPTHTHAHRTCHPTQVTSGSQKKGELKKDTERMLDIMGQDFVENENEAMMGEYCACVSVREFA